MRSSNSDLSTADEYTLNDPEYLTGVTNSCDYTWSFRSTLPLRFSSFRPV